MNLHSKGISTNLAAIAIVAVIIIAGVAAVLLTNQGGYNVTYDANGGGPDEGYTDPWIAKETNFESLDAVFVKDGYAISEWNTAADGSGNGYRQGDAVPGECRVYAIWEKGSAVDYHGNGGAAADGAKDLRVVDERISVCMFSYPGHFFVGWNTDADGSGDDYVPTQAVGDASGLYAQWVKSISDDSGKYTFDAKEQLKTSAAAIKGTFKGSYNVTGDAYNASGDRMGGGVVLSQIALYKAASATDAAAAFDLMLEALKSQPPYTVTESSLAGTDRCVDIKIDFGIATVYCSAALVSNVWVTAADYYTTSSIAGVHACLSDMIAAFPA